MTWFEHFRRFDLDLMFHPEGEPLLLRYGLSVAAVAVSIFLTLVLAPLDVRSPYLFFLPAVVFAVWYGGLWPGLMASLLSTMAANIFGFGSIGLLNLDRTSIILTVIYAATFVGFTVVFTRARSNLHTTVNAISLFLEDSSDPVIIRDTKDKIVFWNSGAAELYGWEKQEAVGRNFKELLRPQLPLPLDQVENELNKFGRWYSEVTHYRKDGTPVVVETAWKIKDDASKQRLILQTDVALAVKKMADHTRQASKVPERMTAEAAGIGFWDWDLRNDRLLCSEKGIRMLGLPAGVELTYKAYLGAVHPEDRNAIDGAIHDALEHRTDFQMEYRVIWPDSSIHWIAGAGRGFYPNESSPAEFMCGVFQDLTKQKEYAADLKQVSERLGSVIETAEMGEWELDTTTHSARRSPICTRIFGDTTNTPEWSYENFLEHVLAEYRPQVDRKIKFAILAKTEWELQTQILRKDTGEIRWIWLRGRPWLTGNDGAYRMLGTVLDITAQKNLEVEVVSEHKKLVEAYTVAKMWPWTVDAETEMVQYDAKLISPFDSNSKHEVPLSEMGEKTHPDDREPYLQCIRQALDNGTPFEGEFRRQHPDGQYHWLLVRGKISGENEKRCVIGISIDIDEIRREQEESERTKQLLEKFIEHAPAGLVMLDRRLRNVQASARYCAVRGVDRKSAIGKLHYDIFPDLPPHFKEAYRKGLSGEHVVFQEDIVAWPDGKMHWVRWEVVPWGDAGEDTGGIIIFSEEITAQKHAEGELKRLNRALNALSKSNKALITAKDEQDLLQTVVNNAAKAGNYLLAWVGMPEPAPAKMMRIVAKAGADVECLDGSKISFDENDPTGNGPMGTCMRTGAVVSARLNDPGFEYWRGLTRSPNMASCVGLPLLTGGKMLGVLALYSNDESSYDEAEVELLKEMAGDLAFGIAMMRAREAAKEESTNLLHMEDQFRQSQKMEAVGQLAGGVAHDFNNLLMVIMSQAEMLLGSMHDGESNVRLKDIVEAADRCADLTRQLLAFSRKQVLQATVVSLNTVVRDAARLLKNAIREDIEVKFALADELRLVKIDRTQMFQVIMNLVINARDAMPSGGHLTLETYNHEVDSSYVDANPVVVPGNYSVLAVTDTGVGMDPITRTRVFEPFFTTKGVGQGTGMGLSTVWGIVRQSGGFVWVYSEVGKGSCFKVYLPWAEAEAAQPSAAIVPKPAKQATAVILLVEDDPVLRRVITGFLTSAGYHVLAAESVETATALATGSAGQIDLMLTDVILVGGNGRELADSLRKKGFKFRVAFMSGYTANTITQHGVLEPGIHFLQKPFTRAALLELMERALTPADEQVSAN